MDSLRTLLLARTHTVVLDPDRVASAATRPTRDVDLDRFEDELAQLGYVMSLDLAMTIRRLPYQAIAELRTWIGTTLAGTLGPHRPHVPLVRIVTTAPADAASPYLRRMLTWLATRIAQPCPWCGQIKPVGALDPCGHLVCRSCWGGGAYAGCPICHRRIAVGDPFVRPPPAADLVTHHDGELRLLHLGFDLVGAARHRFEHLTARVTPLSPDDRAEIEGVIDAMGPKAVQWLPIHIPAPETMAVVLARLWTVAPDRPVMVAATRAHLASATDVLRVAAVLLGGNPGLVEPMRLGSVSRNMRRALLDAIDHLEPDQAIEDMWRHRGLWKRVAERLHPYEFAKRLPVATLAFAALRQTRLDTATFGTAMRSEARGVTTLRLAGDRLRVTPWAGAVEERLRTGDVRGAVERLAQRPAELLRRVDHLVRVAQARQPDAIGAVIAAVEAAAPRATPTTLLGLASHVAHRTAPWPRRVFFPRGEVLSAWAATDQRAPLRGDAIGALVVMMRAELIARAAMRRNFARAVIDRALVDLHVPSSDRVAARTRFAWPRGSELALPANAAHDPVRLFLHWETPPGAAVELELSLTLFDAAWRHVATCDQATALVGDGAAIHAGGRAAAASWQSTSAHVDLELERLRALGARHAVMAVFGDGAVPFERLKASYAGVALRPRDGTPFDPRTIAPRFDLRGRSAITVPLAIDLDARRLRWLDVHVPTRRALERAGGYRAALAHIGRDFADLSASGARPRLWDIAAIHAVARANIVYVRDRTGAIAVYRRRDHEQVLGRLARLHVGDDPDGMIDELPPADAPTWFALLRDDLVLPAGSTGYALDPRSAHAQVDRVSAADLLGDLAR